MSLLLHTGLVADPVCKQHLVGEDHPECPERYDAIYLALCRSGLIDHLQKIPCRSALDEEILLAHTPAYLELVKREIAEGRDWLSTGDTPVSRGSLDAALYAVGGVLNAVEAVVTGKVKNAFCLVRPPGHHATSGRGMGFCLFNNIALAARYAQAKQGIERILIVDWDVHHGNGTQDIFYRDGSVFYYSLHQSPLYPGTGAVEEIGEGEGHGATLNVPLAAGADGRAFMRSLESDLAPAMAYFRPELVLISAGFDAREGDPLGGFILQDEDFAAMTAFVLKLAARYANGRVVSMLEGGYNLGGLASAAVAHIQAMSDV
ncbi:MAG: histone deacetylase [Kiritimatiellia bacterium]|jgi:acetoin utilization deacetylase AcuC-like enzyme